MLASYLTSELTHMNLFSRGVPADSANFGSFYYVVAKIEESTEAVNFLFFLSVPDMCLWRHTWEKAGQTRGDFYLLVSPWRRCVTYYQPWVLDLVLLSNHGNGKAGQGAKWKICVVLMYNCLLYHNLIIHIMIFTFLIMMNHIHISAVNCYRIWTGKHYVLFYMKLLVIRRQNMILEKYARQKAAPWELVNDHLL